jgi:hypothetical protein
MVRSETSYRSFAELDILFENKASARNFHKTNVNQSSSRSTAVKVSDISESTSSDEKTEIVRREQM